MSRQSGLQFYNIRFVNIVEIDDDNRRAFFKELCELFRRVSREYIDIFKDRPILAISPTMADGELNDFELRCFLLPSDKKEKFSRALKLGSPGLGAAGTTWRSNHGTVSEIYVDDKSDSLGLARISFHEFMHNKLKMGDEMHNDFDVGFGLAREQVSSERSMFNRSTAELTQKNAVVMAKALMENVPQYKGK